MLAYKVITTVLLSIIVLIFVLSLTSDAMKSRENTSIKYFLIFSTIVQIMAIGHVWN